MFGDHDQRVVSSLPWDHNAVRHQGLSIDLPIHRKIEEPPERTGVNVARIQYRFVEILPGTSDVVVVSQYVLRIRRGLTNANNENSTVSFNALRARKKIAYLILPSLCVHLGG